MQEQSSCLPRLGCSDAVAHREEESSTMLLEALGRRHQGQGISWTAAKSTDATGSQVSIRGCEIHDR